MYKKLLIGIQKMQHILKCWYISLFFALKERGIPIEIEKDDGFKSIDLAVTEAKINIEVDGGHHNYDSYQALSDLKRTYHSFKKGYTTIRIPNSLIRDNLLETTDLIEKILIEGRRKNLGY